MHIKTWLQDSKKFVYIFLGYFVLLTFLLLKSGVKIGDHSIFEITNGDKILHFIAFSGLSFLCLMAFRKMSNAFVFLIFFLYGGIIEIIQGIYIVGRSADFFDLLADCLGVLIGIFIVRKVFNFITVI